MSGKVFAKSLSFMAAAVLVILAFFRDSKYSQWMFIAVFGLWAVYLLIRLLIPRAKDLYAFLHCKRLQWKAIHIVKQQRAAEEAAKAQIELETPIQPVAPSPVDQAMTKKLIGHISCRITEKLQSVFPDATWSWQETNPEITAQGAAGRIKLTDAGDYTHAEVKVDELFRLSFMMMKMENLQDVAAAEKGEPEAGSQAEPIADIDVKEWFEWVGKGTMRELFTDLNTHGFRKAYIKENGEIYVIVRGNEVVKGTLETMPDKRQWPELVGVMTGDGLTAKVDNDRIAVAWA